MKRCTKCVMPETQETIIYDNNGVCSICRNVEYKEEKIDWKAKEKEFQELIAKYKGKGLYDCIVPFSGGKDSTWTLLTLVKRFKLKPLVVRFDHLFFRPKLEKDAERTFKKLGVDVLKFSPNPHIVQKLMKIALERKGDFCWHCHAGIFAFPMHIAIRFETPLIIWGEPSAEYTSYYDYTEVEEVDEKRFNTSTNLGITAEDMVEILDDPNITIRDLWPYQYPSTKELRRLGYRSICLGSFIPWDARKNAEEIREELGWTGAVVEGIAPEYWYEKVECRMQGIRDHLKYLKRGMARTTHLGSIDIRHGRKDREEVMRMVEEYEGKRPASLDYFLKVTEMNEDEFNKMALKNIISPHKPDIKSLKPGKKNPDQDEWEDTPLSGNDVK